MGGKAAIAAFATASALCADAGIVRAAAVAAVGAVAAVRESRAPIRADVPRATSPLGGQESKIVRGTHRLPSLWGPPLLAMSAVPTAAAGSAREVDASPSEAWTVHRSPEGKRFYYNKLTKERSWRKPKPPTPTAPCSRSPPTTAPVPESHARRKSQFEIVGQPPRASKLALYAYYSAEGPPTRPIAGGGESGRPPSDAGGDSGRPPSDAGDTGMSGGRNGFVMDEEGFWVRAAARLRIPLWEWARLFFALAFP